MKKLFLYLSFLFVILNATAQTLSYKLIENIPYRSNGDPYQQERCVVDVYYPENMKNYPTIVWFHGGGLSGGQKSIPHQLKESELGVIAVNYRLLPKVPFTECLEDAAAAIAWVFNEIENYGGDRNKIFLSGHSAGGYLIALIGLNKEWLAQYNIDANDIAALIPFSGHAISHFAYRESLGMNNYQPSIDKYAPVYYVRPDAPPLVIISGDRELELLGRYEENAYFWRMMKVAGHTESYIYELGGHDHGAMVGPGFHILKNHIKKILSAESNL